MGEIKMKTEITFIRMRAGDIETAKRKIKRRYPRAIIITYKFEQDFKFVEREKRNYRSRIINVAFIKNVVSIKKKLGRNKK